MTYDPTTYWPERYAKQGETYVAKGGRRSSYDRQIKLIVPYFDWLPTEGRVLDFGCGPGRFRSHLEAHGLTYDGYDIIPGLGTVDAIEGGRYDCAVALYVLQHIVDPRKYESALDALYEALRPGGTLLVVDHLAREDMADHMRPRGAAPLMKRFAAGELGTPDDDHWLGVFRR